MWEIEDMFLGFVKDITDMAYKQKLNMFCVMEQPDMSEKPVIENRFDLVVR